MFGLEVMLSCIEKYEYQSIHQYAYCPMTPNVEHIKLKADILFRFTSENALIYKQVSIDTVLYRNKW